MLGLGMLTLMEAFHKLMVGITQLVGLDGLSFSVLVRAAIFNFVAGSPCFYIISQESLFCFKLDSVLVSILN